MNIPCIISNFTTKRIVSKENCAAANRTVMLRVNQNAAIENKKYKLFPEFL